MLQQPVPEQSVSAYSVWDRVLVSLRDQVDAQIFNAYIAPLRCLVASGNSIVITAPSRFISTQAERMFRPKITELLSTETGSDTFDLSFTVDLALASQESFTPHVVVKKIKQISRTDQEQTQVLADAADSSTINPRYTFSNFVVGSSNQFCHAAAMRVGEEPGKSYNPYFIYGGVGLGKTHLLHAIGNLVLEKRPNARILYMSSETFTNELIQALRHAKMEEFKTRFRNVEVLLIDDIQFMSGKERTQEEFFHTFNALYNAKHQIVITSDKIPQDIHGLEDRLKTRFAWGLTADIQAPDFETRVAILKRKAALDAFELPSDVAEYIGDKISSNVRELEGALTKIHAMSALMRSPITLELAEGALRPLLQPKTINITVNDIKQVVTEHFGIKVSDLISKRRTKNLSWPRHVAMYLCRKHTTCSYPEIGAEFGGRDHSSVIHAASVVSDKVKSIEETRVLIEKIERDLRGY